MQTAEYVCGGNEFLMLKCEETIQLQYMNQDITFLKR